LAALVAKSILVADESEGAVRYRLLETMREYARDRLEEAADVDESERVQDRHLVHYRELAVTAAPHLEGADDDAWVERLIADDDNLRVALARARHNEDADALLTMSSALSLYWLGYGNRRDGLMWMETALAMAPDAPAGIRAQVMAWAGSHAMDLGRYEDGRAMLEGSLRCSTEAGEPPLPFTLRMLGILALEENRPELAVQRCEEALAAARERGEAFDELESLWGLGMICALGADETRAVPLTDDGVEMARRLGNRHGLTMALQASGFARMATDPARALALLEEAKGMTHKTSYSPVLSGQLLFFLGIARLRLGELSLAARAVGESLAQFEQVANHYYLSLAMGLTATLAVGHDPGAAVNLLAAADRRRDALGLGGAPRDVEMQRRTRERLASTMAPDEFAAAWDQGQALDLEDAVDLAHRVLDELATGA
ncbi:MAG: hypothetical protein MUP97_12340, partial [Acidimicrobiia bacterium]|nr:hypothetical protein [Acidimicrobiia bacterium]